MRIKDLVVKAAASGSSEGDLIITVPGGQEIYCLKVTKRSMYISTYPFPDGYGDKPPLLGEMEEAID